MLGLNLFFLKIYLHVKVTEGFNAIPNGQSNEKLPATMQTILCSTDSNTIHLFAIDNGTFDRIGEFIDRLNKDCSFKAVQLSSAIDTKQTTLHYHLSGVFVFMVNSRESIHHFLQAVTTHEGSTSHHRFLVVFNFQYDLRTLEKTFEKLSKTTIFTIVVIMRNEWDEIVSVTYDPFDGTFNSVNALDTSEERKRDVFVRSRSDLRRRTLVVSMHKQNDRAFLKKNGAPGYSGVDGLIADLLEERMNVTFTYTTPHEMYNGNKNSGVIGDLIRGEADMSFNADSLAPFLVNGSVFVTEPIERNDICICILVPKAGDEPIVYNLFNTLSKLTWTVTILSLVIMMLMYRWTQAIQKSIHSTKYSFYEYSWTEISTIIFQSFFGDSITRIPISMPLRLLIIAWCVYSFMITNAFQAKLISSLVLPKGLDDIETIEELGHSNLKILYPMALKGHIVQYTSNHTMTLLRDQLVEVKSWSELEAAISNKSLATAFVTMRFHADLMEKMIFDKASGRPLYKTMNECLLTFARVYFLKLGSMYVEYVSELLRRFHEMGFLVKWTSYSDFMNALGGNLVVDENDDDVDEANIKVVITTGHLQSAFYLLFIGLVAATLGFIGENIYFRWMEDQRKLEWKMGSEIRI